MDEQLLQNLHAEPDRLAAELDELPEGELMRRHPDGGRTLKELAGHLRDHERFIALERLPLLLAGGDPALPAFDAEAHDRESRAGTAALGEALSEWSNLREQTVALLRGLGPEDLERTGRDPEIGPVTPVRLAEILLEHDRACFDQALALKALSRDPSS